MVQEEAPEGVECRVKEDFNPDFGSICVGLTITGLLAQSKSI